MRVKCHPTLGILVCTDGHVMVPATRGRKAHWTFGWKNSKGYLQVSINGKKYYVHRLVAYAFIKNPCGYKEVDHIDRDPHNNNVTNLRWVSRSGNNRNTARHDRVDARGGTHRYEDETQYNREKSKRLCKTHKNVRFSDGKRRYIPNSEAILLLAIPVKERTWPR